MHCLFCTIFSDQKEKLREALLSHRNEYCKEHLTASAITNHTIAIESLEEATFSSSQEETVWSSSEREYITPKSVFNNKVVSSSSNLLIQVTTPDIAQNILSLVEEHASNDVADISFIPSISTEIMKETTQNKALNQTSTTIDTPIAVYKESFDKTEKYADEMRFSSQTQEPVTYSEHSTTNFTPKSGSDDLNGTGVEENLLKNGNSQNPLEVSQSFGSMHTPEKQMIF